MPFPGPTPALAVGPMLPVVPAQEHRMDHLAGHLPAPTHQDVPVDALRRAVAGPLVAPDDAGYDAARRVFNHAADRRPAAIVRALGVEDVQAVVALARDHGFELAVRAGGHSPAGHGTSEGGVVLDLSAMTGLDLDLDDRTASAQGGITTGAYTAAVARHGLATGFGDTPTVGVAGLTLAGGMGWLSRKHGLTVDHLLAAEIVTAGGERLDVDADTHPDLFWALRGGGGNFGVVTRLRFRVHEVGTVLGGMLVLPATPDTLTGFVEAAAAAPDELSTIAMVMRLPPIPAVPADEHGRLRLLVMPVYAGDPDEGEAVLAPIRTLARPILDTIEPMPYHAVFDEEEAPPMHLGVRTTFLDDLDAVTAATMLDRLERAATPVAAVQFRVLGGAVGRVANDATAFAHRDRTMYVGLAAASFEAGADEAREAWLDDFLAAVRPAASGAMVAFMGSEGPDRIREAYPHGTFERLVEIKRRYDPGNLFRVNQNLWAGEATPATPPAR